MSKYADARAVEMGARDVPSNNIDPTFRGSIIINGEKAEVINSSVFSGTLHFGIFLRDDEGRPVVGWVPAFLCEIV